MKETLTKIWNVLKSVQGIVVISISLVAVGSSVLLRHDAAVIKKYNDNDEIKKVISYQERDSVEKHHFYRTFDSLVVILRERDESASNDVYALKGSYNALDRSYTRTLEKWVKDKDELIQYKNEQIEELKKKDYLLWIRSDTTGLSTDLNTKR